MDGGRHTSSEPAETDGALSIICEEFIVNETREGSGVSKDVMGGLGDKFIGAPDELCE
jgi:hypothetical protein